MAYDEDMAARIRDILAQERGLSEKRMFGGLAFLLDGHMAVAVSGQGGLLLRIDPTRSDELVADPHVGRMVMRGREMDGWLHVEPAAVLRRLFTATSPPDCSATAPASRRLRHTNR